MVWLESLQQRHGKKWLIIPAILFANMLIIEIGFLMLSSYFGDINLIVSDFIGVDINFMLLVLLIVALPLTYTGLFLIFKVKKLIKTGSIKPHLIHSILSIFLIILFDILVYILIDQLGGYAITLIHLFDFYFLFIFLVINLLLICSLYFVLKLALVLQNYLSDTILKPKPKKAIILGCVVGLYTFSFAMPFFFVPTNVINWDLPPKPDIIAHRGASHIAPENTIAAAEMTVVSRAVGWEIDVQISYDGIPFLMHDNTLTRTTNVEEVFPDRTNQDASLFNISELRQLDAGSWFVDKDPYGALAKGIITQEQAEQYRGEKIPTLDEVLSFTKNNDLLIDFDTKGIPSDHPYHDSYREKIVEYILNSGIEHSNVLIGYNEYYEQQLPNLMFTGGNSLNVQQWLADKYDLINTGDGFTNDEYRARFEASIPVMVYTIDTVERFSELWCLGVKWVKTNEPHTFQNITAPPWVMTLSNYYLLWILVYIIGISAVLSLYFLKIKRSQQD